MTTTVTTTPTGSLVFETTTCSRCGGTGRMPFAAYGGVCFKCHGHGNMLTPAGRSARKLYDEMIEAASPKVEAWAVEVGMVVSYPAPQARKFFTVVGRDFSTTSGSVINGRIGSAVLVAKNGTSHMLTPDFKMIQRPAGEVRNAIITEVVRRRKGATIAE